MHVKLQADLNFIRKRPRERAKETYKHLGPTIENTIKKLVPSEYVGKIKPIERIFIIPDEMVKDAERWTDREIANTYDRCYTHFVLIPSLEKEKQLTNLLKIMNRKVKYKELDKNQEITPDMHEEPYYKELLQKFKKEIGLRKHKFDTKAVLDKLLELEKERRYTRTTERVLGKCFSNAKDIFLFHFIMREEMVTTILHEIGHSVLLQVKPGTERWKHELYAYFFSFIATSEEILHRNTDFIEQYQEDGKKDRNKIVKIFKRDTRESIERHIKNQEQKISRLQWDQYPVHLKALVKLQTTLNQNQGDILACTEEVLKIVFDKESLGFTSSSHRTPHTAAASA